MSPFTASAGGTCTEGVHRPTGCAPGIAIEAVAGVEEAGRAHRHREPAGVEFAVIRRLGEMQDDVGVLNAFTTSIA